MVMRLLFPAGAKHNIINEDDEAELKMYTIYSPAHHKGRYCSCD
jgi:mannose-6-phosphate isomerase-like protein (cupin superfamily)